MTPEELRKLYWDDGLSCVDIGRMIGRNASTVRNRMVAEGIPTRPRGRTPQTKAFQAGHKICVGREVRPETREKLRQARVLDGSKSLFREDGTHVLKGRRGEEIHSWRGGITPERQAFNASDEWKEACAATIARAGRRCERCEREMPVGSNTTTRAFHIHHVASFQHHPKLRASLGNLKLLCAPCHRWVHGKQNINHEMLGGYHEA